MVNFNYILKILEMEKVEIKIDSLTYAPEYSSEFVSRVKQIIEGVKESHKEQPWDTDHTNSRYKGNRYHNNERILQVILGNIRSSHEWHFRKNGLDHKEANELSFTAALEWAKKSNDEELTKIVERALDYSASADYWYKFEKEWD
jgi:hypothetical protein